MGHTVTVSHACLARNSYLPEGETGDLPPWDNTLFIRFPVGVSLTFLVDVSRPLAVLQGSQLVLGPRLHVYSVCLQSRLPDLPVETSLHVYVSIPPEPSVGVVGGVCSGGEGE